MCNLPKHKCPEKEQDDFVAKLLLSFIIVMLIPVVHMFKVHYVYLDLAFLIAGFANFCAYDSSLGSKFRLNMGESGWTNKPIGYIYANTRIAILFKALLQMWKLPQRPFHAISKWTENSWK